MQSSLYEGIVHHERLQPVNHRFDYRLFMAYVDLDELPTLVRKGIISRSPFSAASFIRGDHFGDPRQSLEQQVREFVLQRTGIELDGPIRLLTHLRSFGCYFSPLNLFCCFERDGQTLQAVVAEVQNTPWLQRHCYVLWDGNRDKANDGRSYRHRKSFHVSPFMSLDMEYVWRLSEPTENFRIQIRNETPAGTLFRADMNLRRQPLTRRSLLAMQWRYPLLTARITAEIYTQAFHLWRKKCPYHPHPKQNRDVPMTHSQPGEQTSQGCSTDYAGMR